MTSEFFAAFPEVVSTEAFAAVMALHLAALLFSTFFGALDTAFYCARMHFYEKAIMAAKDVDKLVVRPPFRLWKHYRLADSLKKGDNDAENAS